MTQSPPQADAERRQRAHEDLEAALEAYAEERLQDARELLGAIDLGELNVTDRYRAQSLLAEVGPVETPGKGKSRGRRPDDEPLNALREARHLAETSAEEGERERWRERLAELGARLRREWRLEVSEEEAPLEDCFRTTFYYQRSITWLDDEGRELLLANAFDRWVFVRRVDVASGKVTARVSFRTPEVLARPLATVVDGERLIIAGSYGGVVEIALGNWDVLGWYWQQELVPRDYTIESVVPFPGTSFVWMEVRSPDDEPETYIVDLEAWHVVRRLPGGLTSMIPLVGPGDCRVVYSSSEVGTRIYEADGTHHGTERVLGCSVSHAAVSPDGQGLLFLISRGRWQFETGVIEADHPLLKEPIKDRGEILILVEESDGGSYRVTAEIDLGETLPLGDRRLATSLDEGLCYVLLTREDHTDEILAVAVSRTADAAAALEVVYRVAVPYGTRVLGDRHARRVVAWVQGDPGDGMQVLVLGREEPRIRPFVKGGPKGDSRLPNVGSSQYCGTPTGGVRANLEQLKELMDRASSAELEFMLERIVREEPEEVDADQQVYMGLALRRSYRVTGPQKKFIRKLAKRYPDHPGAALLAAELAVRENRWQEVQRLLGALEPHGLDDGRGRHFYHLQGIAFLHNREIDRALAAFEKAAAYEEGDCQLEALLHVTRPMGNPPEASEWGRGQPWARQVLGALRTVDRQVEAGETEAARILLEEPNMWRSSELQLVARLAAVYLETPVSTVTERFMRRLALARFLAVLGIDDMFRAELVMPGESWDRPRLEELAERVRDALDEDQTLLPAS